MTKFLCVCLRFGVFLSSSLLKIIVYFQGKTLNLANEQGISHAQLPIGEYLEMTTRRVLTINHGKS